MFITSHRKPCSEGSSVKYTHPIWRQDKRASTRARQTDWAPHSTAEGRGLHVSSVLVVSTHFAPCCHISASVGFLQCLLTAQRISEAGAALFMSAAYSPAFPSIGLLLRTESGKETLPHLSVSNSCQTPTLTNYTVLEANIFLQMPFLLSIGLKCSVRVRELYCTCSTDEPETEALTSVREKAGWPVGLNAFYLDVSFISLSLEPADISSTHVCYCLGPTFKKESDVSLLGRQRPRRKRCHGDAAFPDLNPNTTKEPGIVNI